jgi:dTDP-4-amino-4,6-dideoxygalactose transaminase
MEAFKNKIWLATPTMHGEEMKYVQQAYDTNWMSTVGENINEVERMAAEGAGMNYAVGLSCCTAALHLAVKHAGETLYGKAQVGHGALEGKKVFCSDMTFAATLNPVIYEGGTPIFIDTEATSWNMDPVALQRAFEMYPDVKLVISAELYGFPGRMDQIKEICEKNGALLIEDAAEAMGATIDGRQCGSFGDYSAISYNGNKIITGSAGGCLLTNNIDVANKVRKWATQARENASWYQHEEVGYNYRMSNVVAGVVRGQYPYLNEHIE